MKVGFNAAAAAYASAAKRVAVAPVAEAGVASSGGGFADLVKSAAQSTVETLKTGEAASLAAASGKPDITAVVTAVSNAEVTLQAAVAVRDRVIQAYLDVIRMPI
jgi:flagellar hook-basal body complex protein FliE